MPLVNVRTTVSPLFPWTCPLFSNQSFPSVRAFFDFEEMSGFMFVLFKPLACFNGTKSAKNSTF
jgi:hypothetical protein